MDIKIREAIRQFKEYPDDTTALDCAIALTRGVAKPHSESKLYSLDIVGTFGDDLCIRVIKSVMEEHRYNIFMWNSKGIDRQYWLFKDAWNNIQLSPNPYLWRL